MQNQKIVDLTWPLRSNMMVYPGLMRPIFQWVGRDNLEGYNSTRFTMEVHTGTHIDAPLHFIPNGSSIDHIPLNRFYGKAKLLRLTEEPQGQSISKEKLEKQCPPIDEGQILVLDTGVYKFFEKSDFFERYPIFTPAAAQWLVEKKITALATDAPSLDVVGSKDAPIHHIILGAGIPVVENLANLNSLPSNVNFLFIAVPLKLQGREGAPCRAIAILP